MIAALYRHLYNSCGSVASRWRHAFMTRDEGDSQWRPTLGYRSFIKFPKVRISFRAVGAGAPEGVTITVAVMPAANVIVDGTVSLLIRTGIRWASRTHV